MLSSIRALSRSAPVMARSYAAAAAATGAPAAGAVRLTFAHPTGTFYNRADIHQVTVPGDDGDFGILASHVPTLTVLRPGVVTVTETQGGADKKFFVSSGTITVNDDQTVQVLAEEAAALEDLDVAKARAGMDEWAKKQQSAKTDLEKAEADIGFDTYRAMVAALG